jgi:hypothetical protein
VDLCQLVGVGVVSNSLGACLHTSGWFLPGKQGVFVIMYGQLEVEVVVTVAVMCDRCVTHLKGRAGVCSDTSACSTREIIDTATGLYFPNVGWEAGGG